MHRWSGGSARTYLLAALSDGQTYSDSSNGFSVTQLSYSALGAVAQLTVGRSCGAAAPSVTLAPQDQAGPPGTTVVYDVTIFNNDSLRCAPRSLVSTPVVPPRWTGTVSVGRVELVAGASATSILSLTPPLNAAAGPYAVGIAVGDPTVPAQSWSATGSHTVVQPCSNVPSLSFSPLQQSATRERRFAMHW